MPLDHPGDFCWFTCFHWAIHNQILLFRSCSRVMACSLPSPSFFGLQDAFSAVPRPQLPYSPQQTLARRGGSAMLREKLLVARKWRASSLGSKTSEKSPPPLGTCPCTSQDLSLLSQAGGRSDAPLLQLCPQDPCLALDTSMAKSAPTTPSDRPPRIKTRVHAAAQAFEGGLSPTRIDVQQIGTEQDIERLSAAKRVSEGGIKPSYVLARLVRKRYELKL